MNRNFTMRGAVNGQLIAIAGLLVVAVLLAGLSGWLYLQYDEQKTKVDNKVALAEATARKEQAEVDEKKFAEREKEPNREFTGPDDYGQLTFSYPRTWSVYVANDSTTSSSGFAAFLNPVIVPPVSASGAQFALRVTISNTAYDQVLNSYKAAIKKGDLKSSPINVNDHDGTRLDGAFSKNIRGSAVLFKIRDKTAIIQSDIENFKPDFENIIKTIDFNS